MKKSKFGLLLLLVFLLADCSVVPITGRKQMNLLPAAQMAEMGFSTYDAFLKENKLSRKQNAARMVDRAGKRITTAATEFLNNSGQTDRLQHYNWEFKLVEDKTPNAWCVPGGKVVFYEGILPYTKDENDIAVVMGHEIAHAIAKHGNERMSQQLVTQLGGLALAKALEQQPQETQLIFNSVYGIGSQVGVLLPYSRLHEKEADRLGLIFMAMAGYDPNEAIGFWERMSRANNNQQPFEFLSTHPLTETRIADMKANLPEAMTYFKRVNP